jgi:modified peptide precursor CbpA
MKKEVKTKETKKPVIAFRKTCKAKGTGLSHYILMDKKAK